MIKPMKLTSVCDRISLGEKLERWEVDNLCIDFDAHIKSLRSHSDGPIKALALEKYIRENFLTFKQCHYLMLSSNVGARTAALENLERMLKTGGTEVSADGYSAKIVGQASDCANEVFYDFPLKSSAIIALISDARGPLHPSAHKKFAKEAFKKLYSSVASKQFDGTLDCDGNFESEYEGILGIEKFTLEEYKTSQSLSEKMSLIVFGGEKPSFNVRAVIGTDGDALRLSILNFESMEKASVVNIPGREGIKQIQKIAASIGAGIVIFGSADLAKASVEPRGEIEAYSTFKDLSSTTGSSRMQTLLMKLNAETAELKMNSTSLEDVFSLIKESAPNDPAIEQMSYAVARMGRSSERLYQMNKDSSVQKALGISEGIISSIKHLREDIKKIKFVSPNVRHFLRILDRFEDSAKNPNQTIRMIVRSAQI